MARDIFRLAYSVRQEAQSDSAELMLYGEIVEDGPEWWKWSKEDKSAAEFDKAVKQLRKDGVTKLLLRINSPGGVCTQSVAMRAILANAGFEEINIRIEGLCASAATDIATLPGAHVAICEGSEYMIHNPWCMALGNADELEHIIERLRGIEATSRGFYMKKCGKSEEQVKQWMDNETWFTAEQAVEFGFCDELLVAEVASPAAACATKRAYDTMQGLYRNVPKLSVSNETHDAQENAGFSPEIQPNEEETQSMNIQDLTLDELRAQNPALLEQIQQAALEADRQRREDIDAITPPVQEYLAMAERAKKDGTNFTDYQRSLVDAMKRKAADHQRQREDELKNAQNVTGGAPDEGQSDPQAQADRAAQAIAEYAKGYRGGAGNGMY